MEGVQLALLVGLLANLVLATSFEDVPGYPYYYRDWDRAEDEPTTTSKPFIDEITPRNVTVIRGRTATLACVVRHVGTASVSWMRVSDIAVLTMDEKKLAADARMSAIHVPGSDRWALRIRDAAVADSGLYECQVTTANKTVVIVSLNVLDPKTEIRGLSEVYLSKGSTLNLTCVISRGPSLQPYIMWTHDDKMLHYISGEDPSLRRNRDGDVISHVAVAETTVAHSGLYRCEPGEAPAAQVQVHVLDGKVPAAMQRAGGRRGLDPAAAGLALLLQLAAAAISSSRRRTILLLPLQRT